MQAQSLPLALLAARQAPHRNAGASRTATFASAHEATPAQRACSLQFAANHFFALRILQVTVTRFWEPCPIIFLLSPARPWWPLRRMQCGAQSEKSCIEWLLRGYKELRS